VVVIDELKERIRGIPDFPKPGILFRDITPLLADGRAFRQAIDILGDRYINQGIDLVVGVEARGFIMGAALAYKLRAGNVLIRKPGKLPYKTHRTTYALEYGTDTLEIHQDAIKPGQRVLIADDLLATGGTISAAVDLVKQLGGQIVELAFLIELTALKGREKLKDYSVFSLLEY
jgi:adenine phosphoribosyltransferase